MVVANCYPYFDIRCKEYIYIYEIWEMNEEFYHIKSLNKFKVVNCIHALAWK